MRRILDIQQQLLPDLIETFEKRATILKHIMLSGVIGRRTLAQLLNMTERVLRSEVDFLKAQGLIEVKSNGMSVTPSGKHLLEEMEPIVKELFGLSDLEALIREKCNIEQVVIVPGDSDESELTKKELGRVAASLLRENVREGDVIAVTGGSTMAMVAEGLSPSAKLKTCSFVPARGGLGERVELQANTIAATMAKRVGGKYRLLHVPDHLSEEAYQSLIQEPNVQEIIEVIRQAKVVVHGIGDAMVMAARRKVDAETIRILKQDGALAEAFGYYFNRDGAVVSKVPTAGLRLEDIEKMGCVIAVAGGKSKGEAIVSVLRYGHEDILVTDEAAAKEMLRYL